MTQKKIQKINDAKSQRLKCHILTEHGGVLGYFVQELPKSSTSPHEIIVYVEECTSHFTIFEPFLQPNFLKFNFDDILIIVANKESNSVELPTYIGSHIEISYDLKRNMRDNSLIESWNKSRF